MRIGWVIVANRSAKVWEEVNRLDSRFYTTVIRIPDKPIKVGNRVEPENPSCIPWTGIFIFKKTNFVSAYDTHTKPTS